MDYERKDLTKATGLNYAPIRLSHVKSARALNEHVWANLRELGTIVEKGNTQKLKDFFEIANTGDNVQNVLAAGSELGKDSGHFTTYLTTIEQRIQRQTLLNQQYGAYPNARELLEVWNQNKGRIFQSDLTMLAKKTQIKLQNSENRTPTGSQQEIKRQHSPSTSLTLIPQS